MLRALMAPVQHLVVANECFGAAILEHEIYAGQSLPLSQLLIFAQVCFPPVCAKRHEREECFYRHVEVNLQKRQKRALPEYGWIIPRSELKPEFPFELI